MNLIEGNAMEPPVCRVSSSVWSAGHMQHRISTRTSLGIDSSLHSTSYLLFFSDGIDEIKTIGTLFKKLVFIHNYNRVRQGRVVVSKLWSLN